MSLELEVLSELIRQPGILVEHEFKPEYFPTYRNIFEKLQKMESAGEHISPSALVVKGVHQRLVDRIMDTTTTHRPEELYQLIRLQYQKNALLGVDYEKLVQEAENEEQLHELVSGLSGFLGGTDVGGSLQDLDSAISSALKCLNTEVSGKLLTGLADLDEVCRPFEPGMYSILAGRPSMGKTALSRQVALHLALCGAKVLYFSLEEDINAFTNKLVLGRAGLNYFEVKKHGLTETEEEKVQEARESLRKAPLDIDDNPSATPGYMRHKAGLVQNRRGLDVVFVDYIQLIPTKGDNKNIAVGEVSRQLKEMARALGVGVCALSQLTRAADGREPRLMELRDSGSLEQDADCVAFLWSDEIDRPMRSLRIAKQRSGPLARIRLDFDKECGRFSDIA